MYLTYENKTTEVPISTDGGSPVEVVEDPAESEGTFDEFEYEDEALEDAEGFYTESSGTPGKIIKALPSTPEYIFDMLLEILKAHRAIVVKYYERSLSVSSKLMTYTPYCVCLSS
ncbi:hypothetical protein C2G38_2241121 [Gigaspora rosea]|uniref:Uncharacterized protein n=1 Tax=Gigaspora rosea TaxID=44941 RepID=A0A397VTJ4_9GLOM|nr:hypothetical protein C2G38_2241121 [Gigaspora rosea]